MIKMQTSRDAAEFNEASHWPDPAENCDTLEAHIAELLHEEWPKRADSKVLPAVQRLIEKVVSRLLHEGRITSLVEVRRLEGRELMAMVLSEIMHAEDPLLMAKCVDFTLETGVLGLTQTEIASEHHVTKATVSHHCVGLKTTYRGGVPAAGMKSKRAVESYRTVRTGRSSRGPRVEWQFSTTFSETYAKSATY